MSKIKAKKVSIQFFLIVLGISFGVLISAQMRSIPTRVTNPVVPYVSLKETKEELYEEQGELKDSIKSLQDSIQAAQKEAANARLSEDELSNLNQEKARAGLTRLSGPGIVINLNDSPSSQVSEESIVHASDLRDIVNLLWGNGAEAIAINDQRVVSNTAIDCIVNTILINNERISSPFIIKTIGNKNSLYGSMADLGSIDKRRRLNGLIFNYSKVNSIIIPAFDGSFETKGESNV